MSLETDLVCHQKQPGNTAPENKVSGFLKVDPVPLSSSVPSKLLAYREGLQGHHKAFPSVIPHGVASDRVVLGTYTESHLSQVRLRFLTVRSPMALKRQTHNIQMCMLRPKRSQVSTTSGSCRSWSSG